MSNLTYMSGFGNEFESEADNYKGALPAGCINPQRCKFGLVAEQLSGSAFTAPRSENKRSWLYRLRPSVCHSKFMKIESHEKFTFLDGQTEPNQTRWSPFESGDIRNGKQIDFVDGLHTLAFSDPSGCASSSIAIHIYLANVDMINKCFVNHDGDFLLVPQKGSIRIATEFGLMDLEPNEIAVIQQGMKFTVTKLDDSEIIRGYILEVKGNHFKLPDLGPIGSNCLANSRDFLSPTAWIDSKNLKEKHSIICKFQNELFQAEQNHSPYDVAAWFGNYTPYKYDLDKFVSINSVSVDHPDPSIFTVLTCPSPGKPGTALADFVIFPPRWECAKDTFRPPYYHRNCMTEFMGLIKGQYQAKSKKFAPGGASLHQSMIPHGPDEECFELASKQDTSEPKRVADGTMAFMFETSLTLKLSKWALTQNLDLDYSKCWQGLSKLNLV